MQRTILHVDMDAFYASVEQRDNPEFRGKPVIVGAAPRLGRGRGVVSAASYEARKYGIHSAQPISRAYRLCPFGIFLPVRGRRYVQVSRNIMDIFQSFTPQVQAVSLDEAFLDMTGCERLFGPAEGVGREIKKRIRDQEGLTASVGIGHNKLVAKIASDLEKPDGFVVVRPEDVQEFLSALPVKKLWGIGKKTEEKLAMLGIKTVGDLASVPKKTLMDMAGKMGQVLWNHARGIDDSPVISDREAKSVSNEITYSNDVDDRSKHLETLLTLSEKVGYRLRQHEWVGRTVILKVRMEDFSTYVRHTTLPKPIYLSEAIYSEVYTLYDNLDVHQAIRLLGVGMTQLSSARKQQLMLFDEEDEKRRRVTEAVDILKARFGEGVIGRGGMIKNEKS